LGIQVTAGTFNECAGRDGKDGTFYSGNRLGFVAIRNQRGANPILLSSSYHYRRRPEKHTNAFNAQATDANH
jgi:hypothetical protein